MPLSPRTPVLVGVAAVQQREDDPLVAREPLALMREALERAADDAGSRALLARADRICAPRGFWDYPDPCRLLATSFGASGARTEIAEVGVLQTTLFGRAAAAIAAGEADVVLVTGAEARHRAQQAWRRGVEPPRTAQEPCEADVVLRAADDILSPAELQAGLAMPVTQYAMIENALRAAEGRSIDAHAAEVAGLWAAMSAIAAGNPDAWSRSSLSADDVRAARMLAFPYTRLHTSQWNVDQAAGSILCSLATADALGIPPSRRVFPHAVADANHMVPLSARREPHRCPGFALAAARAVADLPAGLADVQHLELYSCFPAAVRVQMRELAVPAERTPSVTGGMAFAGGPLNNFVLQALVAMARLLRAQPGSRGLVTAVSGILTKQGASLWSTEPAARGFRFDDVGAETARQTAVVGVVDQGVGPASVVTYTVLFDGDRPTRGVALCDLPDGRRTLATTTEADVIAAMLRDEWCGRAVRLGPYGIEPVG